MKEKIKGFFTGLMWCVVSVFGTLMFIYVVCIGMLTIWDAHNGSKLAKEIIAGNVTATRDLIAGTPMHTKKHEES